jgi:RNA polymerase sigma factor (sigma-70 family)
MTIDVAPYCLKNHKKILCNRLLNSKDDKAVKTCLLLTIMSDILPMNAIKNTITHIQNWYEAHRSHLTRMALMLGYQNNDAEDFVNQFFLDLLEKNVDLDTIVNPQAFLSTAFKRKLIDHHRKSKARLYVVTDDIQAHDKDREPSAQDIIEHAQFNAELVNQIRKAYDDLPERCKKVIYLKFYKDLNTEQIALQTGLTKRSVYNNLFEGIKILRAGMSRSFPGAQYAAMLSFLPLLITN